MKKVIYWIKKSINGNKNCKSCCVVCKYYEICKEDN